MSMEDESFYFQSVAGYTSSAEWISDDIVYVHDYRRGLEILRHRQVAIHGRRRASEDAGSAMRVLSRRMVNFESSVQERPVM